MHPMALKVQNEQPHTYWINMYEQIWLMDLKRRYRKYELNVGR